MTRRPVVFVERNETMSTEIGRATRRGRKRVDLVARDAEGRPFLVAEIKTRPARPEDTEQLRSDLELLGPRASFGMLVDPAAIRVFRRDGQDLRGPDLILDAQSILGTYSNYSKKEFLSSSYLTDLVDAWLRDLGYRWKSATPPAVSEIAAIGLLPLLESASTRTEVLVGDYTVS
jgi:hypothetical protein